ncbi:ABC transporter permease [Treponema brennaborense]|uniref:ABC3 transporter permease C-terminal domain-containing protein n=1 Tax=Treponema brennaborense (strain DSM 12168 / CIP 105900 / DD5/3) TaxID=906968 RepID=F4LJN4_TREBD|nr:FtsX-like permease family protein [Treponema brennaborense]AEE17414.1 protein of unknown function DUF214 [Treponema brennaborense DSM 12168]
MIVVKLAWTNLWANWKRTLLQLVLIMVTVSSLILYRGYTEYSKQGMALSFIEKTGNLQISKKNNSEYLTEAEMNMIFSELKNSSIIKNVEPVLDFSGIIGTDKTSTIFWGEAYDNPEKKYGVLYGKPVFKNSDSIVIGTLLAEKLGINFDSLENSYGNVLSNTNDSGISLASFNIAGITSTGIPQNDEGLLIASRASILEFLGLDNIASYLQVYTRNDSYTKEMQENLQKKLSASFEVKNWIEMNPSYNQINAMNEVQCTIISVIMCALVFISLTQSISTAFNERLYEFGTLEAIGLKKNKLIVLLINEVVFLSLIGILGGVLFSVFLSKFITFLKITFTPPGYSEGYLLNFFVTSEIVSLAVFFVFLTCILAMIIPIYHVLTNSVVKLMHHVE